MPLAIYLFIYLLIYYDNVYGVSVICLVYNASHGVYGVCSKCLVCRLNVREDGQNNVCVSNLAEHKVGSIDYLVQVCTEMLAICNNLPATNLFRCGNRTHYSMLHGSYKYILSSEHVVCVGRE